MFQLPHALSLQIYSPEYKYCPAEDPRSANLVFIFIRDSKCWFVFLIFSWISFFYLESPTKLFLIDIRASIFTHKLLIVFFLAIGSRFRLIENSPNPINKPTNILPIEQYLSKFTKKTRANSHLS